MQVKWLNMNYKPLQNESTTSQSTVSPVRSQKVAANSLSSTSKPALGMQKIGQQAVAQLSSNTEQLELKKQRSSTSVSQEEKQTSTNQCLTSGMKAARAAELVHSVIYLHV